MVCLEPEPGWIVWWSGTHWIGSRLGRKSPWLVGDDPDEVCEMIRDHLRAFPPPEPPPEPKHPGANLCR